VGGGFIAEVEKVKPKPVWFVVGRNGIKKGSILRRMKMCPLCRNTGSVSWAENLPIAGEQDEECEYFIEGHCSIEGFNGRICTLRNCHLHRKYRVPEYLKPERLCPEC